MAQYEKLKDKVSQDLVFFIFVQNTIKQTNNKMPRLKEVNSTKMFCFYGHYPYLPKGRRQKLLSGFFPLGGGVPPISAKGFFEKWFSAKGVGGVGVPP